ncbi:MAG: helix-turn-helix domain-containing protein [Cyanobacteria bacterium J06649_11]
MMAKKKYYPLTHDEFLELNSKLKDAELRVYLYLMTLNPFPDSEMEIDTSRISEHLTLSRRTIQRAIKQLQDLQLIELEFTKFKYKKAAHGSSSRLGSGDTDVATRDPSVASGDTDVATRDPSVASGDTDVATRDPSVANTHLNPLPDKDFQDPHTNKLTNIQTLSKDERESFLEFASKKASELPRLPVLLNRWIEINFEELEALWKEQNSDQEITQSEKSKMPDFETWDESRHEGQYSTLMSIGLAKFCENAISEAWYEWAIAKYPSKFENFPD